VHDESMGVASSRSKWLLASANAGCESLSS
jgi:hypothetical protein